MLCAQALEQEPECVDALLILGSLAARHGRSGEAIEILKEVLELEPGCADAHRWLATLYLSTPNKDSALAHARSYARLCPEEPEALSLVGLTSLASGDFSAAAESFQARLNRFGAQYATCHNLGIAFERMDRHEEAIDALMLAQSVEADHFETLLHLGRCCLATDQSDRALEFAIRCVELDPNSALARALHSDARYSAAHGPNGMAVIEAAIAQDPKEGFPYALKASRLQEMGDFEGAAICARTSITLQPNQGFSYYTLAHNGKIRSADRTRFESALVELESAEMPLEERQYLHFAAGKAMDDLGEYELAMKQFDLAHKGGGALDPAHTHESRYSRQVRRTLEACRLGWETDLDLSPIDTVKPVFIVGMPRSGTTLIEQILGRHSQVSSCGELFFWRDSARRIIDLNNLSVDRDRLRTAGVKYLELLQKLAPSTERATDKFPSNFLYIGLLKAVFPRATIIHARRHPLDTCLSIYMRPFSTNQGLGRTREEIVETYRLYREAMQQWRDIYGEDTLLTVDYETLVQNPEQTTRMLVDHCGLQWEEACLHPEAGEGRVVTFSKWQVRQPVYTSSVERWRRYEPWLGVFHELNTLEG